MAAMLIGLVGVLLHLCVHFSDAGLLARVAVPHSVKPGHIVTSIGCWGQHMKLAAENGMISKYFTLHNNGELVTNSDISNLVGQQLMLTINNSLASELWQDAVHIFIEDGSNLVTFPQQRYNGNILENQPPGSPVTGLENIYVTRPDKKEIDATYNIVSGNKQIFGLVMKNTDAGQHVQVITKKELDREDQAVYELTIKATTKDGNSAFAKVLIKVTDTNDNIPRFQQEEYSATISSDTPANKVILQVKATDPDEDAIQYFMKPHPIFALDQNTGDISLEHPEDLKEKSYEISVFAEDQDEQQSLPVTVKINVHGSELKYQPLHRTKRDVRTKRATMKVYNIQENRQGDIFQVTVSESGGKFSFKNPAPFKLNLNEMTGAVSVKQKAKLDYEEQQEITFSIIYTKTGGDQEEYPITIRLEDINDEIPQFKNEPHPFLAVVSNNAPPATSVYHLYATDADASSKIRFILESGGEDRFELNPVTGVVRTIGTQPFEADKDYVLGVSAQDIAAPTEQKTKTEALTIRAGPRDPQFFQAHYKANVPENAREQFSVTVIKAQAFQKPPCTYQLMTNDGGQSDVFNINGNTGTVELMRVLDYEKDARTYYMKVKAVEPTNPPRSSTVSLTVTLVDVNDNAPTFTLSQYIVDNIPETVGVGSPILQVTATDRDSATNSQLTYYVDSRTTEFTVESRNNIGFIKTSKKLDYDRPPGPSYNFTIYAKDNGTPTRSGSAMVQVTVNNLNDEKPEIQQQAPAQVFENANPNTVVGVVQANDPDGDNIKVRFKGGRLTFGPFEINPDSSIVTLKGALESNRTFYTLPIEVTDDGSCCGGTQTRTNTGIMVVEVIDVNNNPPRFPKCAEYAPIMMEGSSVGTSVITVVAIDDDKGQNGNITYSLVKAADQAEDKFNIDSRTGFISTSEIFDRERTDSIGIAVMAEDQGNPKLQGICAFQVKIGDKNDNTPLFDYTRYEASVDGTARLGTSVTQVYATDKDSGKNAEIEYFMEDDPSGLFHINPYTGLITCKKDLSNDDTRVVKIKVGARDRGDKPNVRIVPVDISITSDISMFPKWIEDYSSNPIRIRENTPVDTVIYSLKALSSIADPEVTYFIKPGNTPEQNGEPRSFYSTTIQSNMSMALKVYRGLDFEQTSDYKLTIRVSNRADPPRVNVTRLNISLIDVNDEIPQFVGRDKNGGYVGSVAENSMPPQQVIAVTAIDKDHTPKFREITYSLQDPRYWGRFFYIHPKTGMVETRATFDREKTEFYTFSVVAEDGAPSDRQSDPNGPPNRASVMVTVQITDQNDNSPYFPKKSYSASVEENAPLNKTLLRVQALDVDIGNILQYSITAGNLGNAFAVHKDIGDIYVAGNLDFEKGPKEYDLTYRVFDGKFSNETQVKITVIDINDNAPVFTQHLYEVRNILEEEDPSQLPMGRKYLTTVSATDPDDNRKSNIRYRLTGQFAKDGTFDIDPITGQIYLKKKLDRDEPNGRPVWNFNVLATDEPMSPKALTGYAEVRIYPKDINDNAPIFDQPRLKGEVNENSAPGTNVMTVIAKDPDEGMNGKILFSVLPSPDKAEKFFKINTTSGAINTTSLAKLDRETKEYYYLIIQATDRGSPSLSSTATATIRVLDMNDHAPVFRQKIYRATMSESLPQGASVTSVSAIDKDIGENAKLRYSLSEADRSQFYIESIFVTNTGVVKIYKMVDYDDLIKTRQNPFFNLTVTVQDSNSAHRDTAHILITVVDYNDNAPKFDPPIIKQTKKEDIPVDTYLATFTATDIDSGKNAQFHYSIDRASDKLRQFSIDESGVVKTAKKLDRETLDVHYIRVLAIDEGSPQQTGSGTLILTLEDVNDNFPKFAKDYRPIVWENEDPPKFVVSLSATDSDTVSNGPAYTFWTPCRGRPCGSCPEDPTCPHFRLTYLKSGDKGKGSANVTTLSRFDREKQKYYLMPVIIQDSGNPPMSGTNTLTITIGDKNDNIHGPGHKDITVYNYRGEFADAPLGRVHAEDPDDWDVVDKEFIMTSKSSEQYFSLDKQSGMIYMKKGTPEGTFTLTAEVYDRIHDHSAPATVTIHVKEISDEAVHNSGSLRLSGMTAEEFVDKPKSGTDPKAYGVSMYDKFRAKIASLLGKPKENVDIFTVRNVPGMEKMVDVRFSAHGSPYYRPSKLNGLMESNKNEFEKMGLKIAMIPVDECYKEVCESGGCTNVLKTTNQPLLIQTNGTSLVGVTSYIVAECVCAARTFSNEPLKCETGSCLNGGKCVNFIGGTGFRCECLAGFDGPRCQQTKHSFAGKGWAWFEPLAQCEDSHTSIEFLTQDPNGLIMYNGPISALKSDDPTDFISLELVGGHPKLRIDHGSGETSVSLPRQNLADGVWHRIDIFRTGKKIRMIVDHCSTSRRSKDPSEDRSSCEVEGVTPGENKYINVKAPLQLGGRANPNIPFPKQLTSKGFNGCIKNLYHDGKLYDLHSGSVGMQLNSEDGCPREAVVCGANDAKNGPFCGINGTCIGSFKPGVFKCVCKPGWRGDKCTTSTTVKDFEKDSYIEWTFKADFYRNINEWKTAIQLMFRTRQTDGMLFTTKNAMKAEYLNVEIKDRIIQLRFNLGAGRERALELTYANVTDGEWHMLKLERYGKDVFMKLDGGEGRFYNYSIGGMADHRLILVSQREVFAGGDVKFPGANVDPIVDDDLLDSCMNDIRFDGKWMPMEVSENKMSVAADVRSSQKLGENCVSTACASFPCPPPLVCFDLWRYAECRCPLGQKLTGVGTCIDINECAARPCIHGDCVDLVNDFNCNCHDGWEGKVCNSQKLVAAAVLSTGAILAIVICLIILLILILLFVLYSRRRQNKPTIFEVDPADDIRENIINYDEEGVGEEDQDAYDINRLKKPIDHDMKPPPPPIVEDKIPRKRDRPLRGAPGEQPDVGDFINNRLDDADYDPNAPPHDSVREYAYEGGGSTAGSLSSLGSTSSSGSQNYDYLNDWGPRFAKLADMYGAGENPEED